MNHEEASRAGRKSLTTPPPLLIATVGVWVVAMTVTLRVREAFDSEDPTYTPIPATTYVVLAICAVIAVLPPSTGNGHPRRTLVHLMQLLAIAAMVCLTGLLGINLLLGVLRLTPLIPLPVHPWSLTTDALGLLLVLCVVQRAKVQLQASTFIRSKVSQWRPPHWVVIVGFISSLVYPLLKTYWALGGTIGTNGYSLQMGFIAGWGTAIVGIVPTVLLAVTLCRKSSSRLFLDFAAAVGFFTIALGLPALLRGIPEIASAGFTALAPGSPIQQWAYLVVYLSWTITGIGLLAATWRDPTFKRSELELSQ